jgi:hypothetical protein
MLTFTAGEKYELRAFGKARNNRQSQNVALLLRYSICSEPKITLGSIRLGWRFGGVRTVFSRTQPSTGFQGSPISIGMSTFSILPRARECLVAICDRTDASPDLI